MNNYYSEINDPVRGCQKEALGLNSELLYDRKRRARTIGAEGKMSLMNRRACWSIPFIS